MAFYKPMRTAAISCLIIKPKCYQSVLRYTTIFRPRVPLSKLSFCRNVTRYLTKNLVSYDNLIASDALSMQRCISTTRSQFINSQSRSNDATATGIKQGTKSTLYYITALGVLALGLSYAAVPLYRIFCQAYSYGGTTKQDEDSEKIEAMQKVEDRVITVRFNADTASSMAWNFKPQQVEIKVLPGETALAFYIARNPTDRPVIGVSTYNVIPFDAGQYFNKIQCFCFEEQLLNPHEEVHMPVFFYIDPEFAEDPKMENVDMLTLSYTFFEARKGIPIPIPNFARN